MAELVAEAQRHHVTLTDIAFGGDCIARIDNQVVFASYGLPGEEVLVEMYQHKRDYQRGRVVEVITPAAARVEPRCPLFGQCGGCRWQHIAYPTQTELKRKIVVDQLRRLGGFGEEIAVNSTIGAEEPWHYRNHARFSFRRGQLGFTIEHTRRFLPVERCFIMQGAINEVLATLQGRLTQRLHQVAVRYGVQTGGLLINPALQLDGLPWPTGQLYLEEMILQRKFRIAAASFFQVNTAQAERLISYAIERLDPKGHEIVADIYCGVGTFGLLIADKARHVIGIEDSAAALKDGQHNARGIDNVTFIRGAAESVMPDLPERIDSAIIDPPRAGCKPEVVEALRRLRPGRIVYVSCDPATLARDLRLLSAEGYYAIQDIQPIDMFPHTYHIETVATLQAL